MIPKAKVKSYEQRKKEREGESKKREENIQNVLNSAQNNPKFIRLLNYSLNSIDNFISPPNSEIRLNAKIIIQKGGIDILKNIALKNKDNEEVVNHIADIIYKLTSIYNTVDNELAQQFIDSNGHKAVMDLLIKKPKGPSSFALFKTLNGLVKVPHLVNCMIASGLIDTMKQVNDLYTDDIGVISLNFDTLLKVSHQKSGREMIAKKGVSPFILQNIKTISDSYDVKGVPSGLAIVDNVCRLDEGKKAMKDADAANVLCQVVDNFNGNEVIINKSAKIFAKIFTKADFDKEFNNFKAASKKFSGDTSLNSLINCKSSLSLISNMALVEDLGKNLNKPENFDELIKLFNQLDGIDLVGKPPEYVKEYINAMKHFMNAFKRVFDQSPDLLDIKTKRGGECRELIKKINNSIKKNWENTKATVDELEKKEDSEADQIKGAFKGFFTSYGEILNQQNNTKSDAEKKDNEWNEIINYSLGEVIANGAPYLTDDERPNHAASKILKIADELVSKNPELANILRPNLRKCIPYINGIIGFSNNYKTLSNDMDVVENIFKGPEGKYKDTPENAQMAKEIIPGIIDFMIEKPKFRSPNLTNLNILDGFLTQKMVSDYQSKIKNPKANQLGVDYVDAINSVMANQKADSHEKQDESMDDILGDSEELEPKNDETEKKIIEKGSELLKRLIPVNEFIKESNELKNLSSKFNPDNLNPEIGKNLQKALIYQYCTLNVQDFFNAGMTNDFAAVKDLILKEINYIESFKRIKANESNPQYHTIVADSQKRLKLAMGTMRQLENQAINGYNTKKDEKCKNLLKDIMELNNEINDKSTDSPNLIDHLVQIRKNIPFIREKEKELGNNKSGKPLSEGCVNSLMNLFRKALGNDPLCDGVIKDLIGFADQRRNVCDNLVRSGCPRLLMQVLENTQNKNCAKDAVELLNMLTKSSPENAAVIGNQNILFKLFEIRSKFAYSDEITKKIDKIANEIMKSPDQLKLGQELLKEAIADFHTNLQKNFNDKENKQKILNNEEVINSFTSNKKAVENILQQQFIDDLTKAVDQTVKSPEISQTIDKLLTNELGLINKIKENLPKTDDKHGKLIDNAMKILLDKNNYIDPLIVSCKCLGSYIADDELFNKHASKKIGDSFIDKLFAIQEDNLDNPEVTREINNILCQLAVKNPKYADAIVKNGGLANVIDELKHVANLNDPASKALKENGLKMLNCLLNDDKNLDKFIKANGVDLINKIVKNEINNNNLNKDELPLKEFFTDCTICTKTPEQIKTDDLLGRFDFPELVKNAENAEEKKKQLMQDLLNNNKDENKNKEDTDTGNYCVQCLKIINKGLNKDKKEFVDDKIVSNLSNLAQMNFPDKYLFNEIANVLTNKNVTIPNNTETTGNLLKLGLSNKALFYPDNNVKNRVEELEKKIANMLAGDNNYKTKFKQLLADKKLSLPEKNKLLTFTAMLADKPDIAKPLIDDVNANMCTFFNDMLNSYKPTIAKILTNKKKPGNAKELFNIASLKNDEKYDEGVVLALGKLYNHLLDTGAIKPTDPKNKEYLEQLDALADPLYDTDNYIFINSYEKEIDKAYEKVGKVEGGKPDPNDEIITPTKSYLCHLDTIFPKAVSFLNDLHKEIESTPVGQVPEIPKEKEENLDKILTYTEEFFKSAGADPKLKAEECKRLKNPLTTLFDDLASHNLFDKNKFNGDEESMKKLQKNMNKLWGLIGEAIKNDTGNNFIDTSNPEKVKDMVKRINDMIAKFGQKDNSKLRFIPLNISRRDVSDEDINKSLIDFVKEDINNRKKNKEDIPENAFVDLEILANVSKHPGSMKSIVKDNDLLTEIIKEIEKPNLTIKQRGKVSELIRNCTNSNYDVENIIKRDPKFIKEFIKKLATQPIKSLDKEGKEVAKKEIETLCNLLKDENNVKALNDAKILNEQDLKNIVNAYDQIDKNLTAPLRPLITNFESIKNKKKQEASIVDDDNTLKEIAKRVAKGFELHKTKLSKFPDNSNKTDDNDANMDAIELASNITKKRSSFITGTLLFNPNNDLVKPSPLDTNEEKQMDLDLDQILSILRKNYADLVGSKGKDSNLDKKKLENITTCLNLLKQLSLAPVNHKPILDRGFMNFMENLNDHFKLVKKDGNPNTGDIECCIMVGAKDVLQACSNSLNAQPIIRESPVFLDIIDELKTLYDKPDLVKNNEDVNKCFKFDNIIFSNLGKDKKGFDVIFNRLGLDNLLKIGQKSCNPNLLENILSMLIDYVKNCENKDAIPNDKVDSIFNILDKCINLKSGKTPGLMSKCLILGGLMYDSKHAPKVDNIDLIKNMNNDINMFKDDVPYVNTCLNTLTTLANKQLNCQKAINSGLVKQLNDQVSKFKEDDSDKTIGKGSSNNNNDYIKSIFNLTKLYNKIANKDPGSLEKFNSMGMTDNSVKFLNKFNNLVEPLNVEERRNRAADDKDKTIARNKMNLDTLSTDDDSLDDDDEDVDNKTKNELIVGIMSNSMNTMKKVTASDKNNEFIANKTPFGDTCIKTLGNPNTDKGIVGNGLKALDNYLRNEKGKNYTSLNLNELYNLLSGLQDKYYSDPAIIQSINNISSNLVNNLKDNNKDFAKKFYELINDSTKLQDWNPEVVLPALQKMDDGLTKKPYLTDEVGEKTIPNVLNLLKLYKDNPEIQDVAYNLLNKFSQKNAFALSMVNSGLVGSVKETLQNANFNDNMINNNNKPSKETIFKLLNNLCKEETNSQVISDELMNPLLKEINKKGGSKETIAIMNLLDKLLNNNRSVNPFVQYNGIDSSLNLLDNNPENVELDNQLLRILKKVAGNSDEYKQIMQEKKAPDIVNKVIKKAGPYDKNIELQGRDLNFLINSCKVKLEDVDSIGLGEIKIEDPIPPEVRNFLTNGKQVKIISEKGDVKQKQLIFNNDFKKISCKKVKSNLPPKPKYIIDTPQVKKIIRGYATDAFKKSGGLFHKAPKPELCFSIIGPTSVDGTKIFNVVCDDAKEAEKWVNYIEIIINYFKRNKTIKGTVVVKKQVQLQP